MALVDNLFSSILKKIISQIHTSLLTGSLHAVIDYCTVWGFDGNMFPVAHWEYPL